MAAHRTQLYLPPELRARVDHVAQARGVSMAEVIRTALEHYLEEKPDPAVALQSTFGADPSIAVPSRDEWERG